MVPGLCVTIGHQLNESKGLKALRSGSISRLRHIRADSSGKVMAKWISFTATIVLLDDMPLFPKKCDGHLMFRGRRPHQDSPARLAYQWPKSAQLTCRYLSQIPNSRPI